MANCIGFLFLVCVLQLSVQTELQERKYFSAVVEEYNPVSDVQKNIEHYDFAMSESIKTFKADIIVFPERSLTLTTKDAEIVPEPKDNVIPYKNGTYAKNSVMSKISEAAARHKLYTVINLFEMVKCTNNSNCPDRGYFLYDTDVAFDRQGTVIAKYRKYNVYSGNQADKPEKPDLSTFTTDFGVTFGMFTGFDILHKTPALDLVQQKKIKYFVFPSRWPGELPFLTGVQVQDGWSYAMNANLLAAGANDVESGCSGTGIYVARQNKISVLHERTGWDLVHWAVPTTSSQSSFVSSEPIGRKLQLLQDPSIPESQGKDLDLNVGKFQEKICHSEICCNFDVKYKKIQGSDDRRYKYRAVAFQGVRRFGVNLKHTVEYCAVVLCTDGNCAKKPEDDKYPLEFENIKIDASFKKSNTLQFPSTLVWSQNPTDQSKLITMPYNTFTFEKTDTSSDVTKVALSSKWNGGSKNLITFAIFGRKFD